jgi:hypothetical protein
VFTVAQVQMPVVGTGEGDLVQDGRMVAGYG